MPRNEPIMKSSKSTKSTKSTKTTTSDVATQATAAIASLKQLVSSLPIDDSIPPNQMSATRVTSRVPLDAMMIASSILADNPKQFPQFDAGEAKAAIEYEQQMAPVGQAALVLSKRITKSILKRRSGMAHQTLALYQVMKGTSRLDGNEETRTQVQQLKKLFTTKRKTRDTEVTQDEAQTMVKTRKGEKKSEVAQAKLSEAANEAAAATAQANLDAAIAAGNVAAFVAPAAASPAPPAGTVTTGGGTAAPVAAGTAAAVTTPSH